MDCGSPSPSFSSARHDAAAHRLAGALAIPTVSHVNPTREDDEAFLALRGFLEKNFPLVHGALAREIIGQDHALLYTWRGSEEAAEPWLLSSHQDVVPVEPGAESRWTHPPFGGRIAEGYIWGRGALDLKVTLLAALEAAEHLLAERFRPRRTIYFSFGADEEVGGKRGAREIAARLWAQGVRLAFTLDEGGMVLSGAIPGVQRPVALIGVAEKGEILLRLRAEDAAGHSSMPGRTSSVGRLAHAIAAIDDHPMGAGLEPPMSDTFTSLAAHARQPYRLIYRNCRLLAPLLLRLLRRDPMTDALVRTTTATTVVQSGAAENVIPGTATAVINARARPGDGVADVVSHLRRLVERYGVAVEIVEAREASRVSGTDTAAFRVLCETIRDVMPDAVPAPFLSLNATDSRHYEPLARDQYRFVPVRVRAEDLGRIHGVDERISVENYRDVVRFLIEFIRNADRP
jgi:carboxypeptidase PM20D1